MIIKWYENAVIGGLIGVIVGWLSLWQSNMVLAVTSLITWSVLMCGYPRANKIWRINLFWISAFCLPISWAIYIAVKH